MGAGIIAGNVFSQTVLEVSLTPSAVSTITAVEQTFTVPGVKLGDHVAVNPPGTTSGVIQGGARVSAANTIAIQYVNPTVGSVTPLAGTHRVLVTRYDGTAAASRVLT